MNAPLPNPFRSSDQSEPVSKTLDDLASHYREQKAQTVTIQDLMMGLRHRGFALLMLVLVLPNCVPVPIPPGGSTILSLPLFFISLQMLFGMRQPWMPKWLRQKSMAQSSIDKVVKIAGPRLRWVEKFLKHRLHFTHSKAGERFVGFMWLVFAISIAVPLPMTNFVPGVGTLIMALGMLSRDGIVVIVGVFIGLCGVTFTVALLTLGTSAILAIFPFLEGKF
jgi:hypothetical protein